MLTHTIFTLHPLALAGIALVVTIGGTAKGMLGTGLPLVAVPLLAQFIELPVVVALLSVPTVTANVVQALEGGSIVPTVRRLWPIMAALILGTWAGVHLLVTIDRRLLYGVVGSAFVVLAARMLARPHLRIGHGAQRWAGPFVGLFAGVLGGMSGMFGPALVAYFVGVGLTPDVFVKTISVLFLAASATLLLTLGGTGTLGWTDLLISAAAIAPMLIGITIGRWLRGRCSPKLFRILVLCVLALGGLNMLRRALF